MTDERIVKWKCPECGNYHKWVWDIYDIFGGEITMVCDNPECGRTSKMYMVVEKGGNATAFVSAFNGNVEEKLRKATEKVMNSQMTETEKIKAEIKVLEKKLSFLEELERTKTPCEEAFKRVYGYFPTEPNWDDDEVRWESFQKGYNASQKDYKVGEYQATPKEPEKWDVVRESVKWCEEHPDESVEDYLKPKTPEQTEKSLRESFQKVQQTEKWKETQRKIDSPKESWMNKSDEELVAILKKNPPKCLEFQLGKSLEDRIYKWWETCFVHHPEWSMEECVEDLLDIIELYLPRFQSAAGSQSLGVEDMVEGFNDCLNKIKSKLRNKKDT